MKLVNKTTLLVISLIVAISSSLKIKNNYKPVYSSSTAISFLKKLAEVLFEPGSTTIEKTEFKKNFNFCLRNFENENRIYYETKLKQFYEKCSAITDIKQWNNEIIKSTVIQQIYADPFNNGVSNLSCGNYIEKKLAPVPNLPAIDAIIKEEFGGFIDSHPDTKMVDSMFHQHRTKLYPGAFTDLNTISRGGTIGKTKSFDPNLAGTMGLIKK